MKQEWGKKWGFADDCIPLVAGEGVADHGTLEAHTIRCALA